MKTKCIALSLLFLASYANASFQGFLNNLGSLYVFNNNNLCQKADFFKGIKSIRSLGGKNCESEMGAALAFFICENYDDFKISKCADNARGKNITDAQTARSKLISLNDQKIIDEQTICTFISTIEPGKSAGCQKAIADAKTSSEQFTKESILRESKDYLQKIKDMERTFDRRLKEKDAIGSNAMVLATNAQKAATNANTKEFDELKNASALLKKAEVALKDDNSFYVEMYHLNQSPDLIKDPAIKAEAQKILDKMEGPYKLVRTKFQNADAIITEARKILADKYTKRAMESF